VRLEEYNLRNFGPSMLFTRLFGVLFVVFSTYNPTGWSLWHWFANAWPRDWTLLVPIAALYVVIYVILIRAAYRSLRPSGIALAVALLGSIAWVLIDADIVPLDSVGDLGVVLLYVGGGALAIGMTWNFLWLRLTGQVIVDDLTQ
jgi:hypothetical protein